jgi:hypothetical protein
MVKAIPRAHVRKGSAAKKRDSFPDNLEKLPSEPRYASHAWVDYLELLCLADVDGLLLKNDALDRIKPRSQDLMEGAEPLGQAASEADSSFEPQSIEVSAGESSSAELDDKWTEQIGKLFEHFHFRAKAFGAFYPFTYDSSKGVLSRTSQFDLKQKFYISLLLSANLSYIGKQHHALTNSFEALSEQVVKTFLPHGAEVHVFGTTTLASQRYKGNAWAKVNALAKDLKERVTAPEGDFAPTNVGDSGLDFVAWVPPGDDCGSLLTIFGQCACTDEWVKKQFTSSPESWRTKMTFSAQPHNMIVIPICLRNADGTWHVGSDIRSIMIDRPRVVHCLKDRMDMFEKLPSSKVVDELIQLSQSVV